jgi:arsenate reductase
MKITLWHNPRCSKSRAAKQLLEEAGADLDVVDYLERPPSAARLREVLAMLGVGPRGLLRDKENVYRELDLTKATDAKLIAAMAENPILIERPVAIQGKRAVVGRPPENVLDLLKGK